MVLFAFLCFPGKGRGRQVIGVARTSDLVIMMLDAGKADIQKELLTQELDAVGIRINRRRPDITVKHKKTGGVSVTSTCGDLTHLDVHQARNILHLYKIHNVDVLVREDVTIDEFIDVVEGNRIYLRCLYVSTHTLTPASLFSDRDAARFSALFSESATHCISSLSFSVLCVMCFDRILARS